jgi:hypothetical protein
MTHRLYRCGSARRGDVERYLADLRTHPPGYIVLAGLRRKAAGARYIVHRPAGGTISNMTWPDGD